MPTCLSHFLIFCIHCSPFGNRSKWRRRRAAVVIATAKGQTPQLGWNKKSWGFFFFFFSFSFLAENISPLWTGGMWLTLSVLNRDSWSPTLIPPTERGNCQSVMGEGAWWHLYWKAFPILFPRLGLSFVFTQHSSQHPPSRSWFALDSGAPIHSRLNG